MSSTTASFYSEIMPMDGLGGKTLTTTTKILSASTSFFAEKRFATKDQLVDTKSDVMSFENVGARSRGIRPWEKARFEAIQRRQKDAEFFRRSIKPNYNKNQQNKIIPEIKPAWSESHSDSTTKSGASKGLWSESHSDSTNTVCWMPVKQKPVSSSDIRQMIVVDAWDD